MTDIPHILYNTIGDDFTKYLQPKDLLTLSKVSKTTREEDTTSKFRELVIATMKEYEIFKVNNKIKFKIDMSLNNFLKRIPLGVIYKNYNLQPGTDINLLLDYIDADDETRLYVWIELCYLEDFKRYVATKNLSMEDIGRYIYSASLRLRPDIVQLMYELYPNYSIRNLDYYQYYPITKELRDIFIKHEPKFIEEVMFNNGIYATDDPELFGISSESRTYPEPFDLLFNIAMCFQEQDTFMEYYKKYDNSMNESFVRILNEPEYKYIINPVMTMLSIN